MSMTPLGGGLRGVEGHRCGDRQHGAGAKEKDTACTHGGVDGGPGGIIQHTMFIPGPRTGFTQPGSGMA